MLNWNRALSCLSVLVLVACGSDATSDSASGGSAGNAGSSQGGSAGAGTSGGAAGAGGSLGGSAGQNGGSAGQSGGNAGQGGAGAVGGSAGSATGGSAGSAGAGATAGAGGTGGTAGQAGVWQPMNGQTQENFRAVWGVHPQNVWAVAGARVRHYVSGDTWSSVDTGAQSPDYLDISGPTGMVGTQDIWAVGNRISSYNMNAWSGTGFGASVTGPVRAVLRVGAREVVIGAQNGVFQFKVGDADWTARGAWTGGAVAGLWSDADTLFATSGSSLYTLPSGSSTWSADDTGFSGLNRGWVTGSGSSASHFVASADGVLQSTPGGGWTRAHGDGTAFHGVWGSGPSDVFFVGDAGAIVHFDGTSYNDLNSGTTNNLNDVWGAGPTGPVFVVGDAGTLLRLDR